MTENKKLKNTEITQTQHSTTGGESLLLLIVKCFKCMIHKSKGHKSLKQRNKLFTSESKKNKLNTVKATRGDQGWRFYSLSVFNGFPLIVESL
jgi:hypothetical protein